jgi:chorismate--pyruvate lyase
MTPFSRWQPPQKRIIPQRLWRWLTNTGSLTQLLEQHSQQGFSVKVLLSGWQSPTLEEARRLKCDAQQKVFCREVLLLDGETPRIFARTVVPIVSYPALKQRLTALGNASLSALLFSDPTVERGPLEVSRLTQGDVLLEHAQLATESTFDHLWARRSCFKLKGHALLVSEVFLPGDQHCPW